MAYPSNFPSSGEQTEEPSSVDASAEVEAGSGVAPNDGSGEASVAVDEIPQTCAVCEKPIDAGEEYLQAAYGPVHIEPCSHQPKELGDEDTGAFI